ncbi:MAG: molybdopterin-dependent oxidoreductase [Candidatus Binatia bacterium]
MGTRIVQGFCPLDCPDTCAWQIEVDEAGKAVAIRGDREHPFTAGALCGKVNRYLEAVYSPDRLHYPLRRAGRKGEGRFERISWDEAIRAVADGLHRAIDRHGPEAILPYYYAGTMGFIQGWTLGPRLFHHLGASRLMLNLCAGAAYEASVTTLGGSVGFDPEDIVHAKLIILWGTNPLNANVHLWKFVLEARHRGAHLVAIDPIRSASAAQCDQHLAPVPGTDGALALGLMRVVLDEGAEDREWLERHTIGWPQLEARLGEWPVERAAAVCGLDAEVIRALGQRLCTTRPTAIKLGLGLQRHGGAGAAFRTILAIPALTGDWRHLGGGALAMTGGHFPYNTVPVVTPPGMAVPNARTINMARLGEALTQLDDPPVTAMVVFNANPATSNPNANLVRKGLAREDLFLVVLEQRLTDTADFADIVLPVTMQPEHHDLYGSYGHNYLQFNEPAIRPPGECINNTEVFRRLAAAMGLQEPRLYDSDLEIARQLLDTDAARQRGIDVDRLRERGWLRAAGFTRGTAPFANGGFPTASGKVELYSEALEKQGKEALVGFVPPHEILDQHRAARYPLVLMAPAGRFFLNSTFASIGWHRHKMGRIQVHLHPQDAAARGLKAGDALRVFNDRGAFLGEAVIDDAARQGVAFMYKNHWPKLVEGGANANATTPTRDADLAGAPTFHDNRVEIVSATAA